MHSEEGGEELIVHMAACALVRLCKAVQRCMRDRGAMEGVSTVALDVE